MSPGTVRVGIDLEQFIADPHATGIQRVLHALAREWPSEISAGFVIPGEGCVRVLEPAAAEPLIGLAFAERTEDDDLAVRIGHALRSLDTEIVRGELQDAFSHWLLPEVSYLPSVASRARHMRNLGRLAMIGYDALPMTEPANYRFVPGRAASVNEYFRLLASAQTVVAISEYSRTSIDRALRRVLPTRVAHPGGDHVTIRPRSSPKRLQVLRVGTLEARKMPVEIAEAFMEAVDSGLDAELVFIGRPSASDESINTALRSATATHPVRWIPGAPDREVYDAMHRASHFLSVGTEGYGIPVLEAIRLNTPVLYGGVQPAGELMRGHGAHPVAIESPGALTETFLALPELGDIPTDPERVPTWRDFVATVVEATVG